MKVLITSGGTTEYIDDVRVLTNISSGRLGAEIAHAVAQSPLREYRKDAHSENPERTHQVTYVHARNATMPSAYDSLGASLPINFIEVTDVASLMKSMAEQVPLHDVVIHAMAVSDFGFKRDGAIKLKSSDPEAFIESMRQRIQKNPKVISYVKTWNPNCKLIGFKFEVGQTHEDLVQLAHNSIEMNNCDAMIVNDLEEMKSYREHIAYWVTKSMEFSMSGKREIAQAVVAYVNQLS